MPSSNFKLSFVIVKIQHIDIIRAVAIQAFKCDVASKSRSIVNDVEIVLNGLAVQSLAQLSLKRLPRIHNRMFCLFDSPLAVHPPLESFNMHILEGA